MKAFALSRVVRSVILEITQDRLPAFRDPLTGEISDKALTLAVVAEMDAKHRDIAKQGRREAWAASVYQIVRWYMRNSKTAYAVHDREHRAAEQGRKSRQRRMVTFRTQAGVVMTKDRLSVRKDEIPFVRAAYERIGVAAADVIAWLDAVWEQMELAGLGDDALIGAVVSEAIDEEAA